MKVMAMVIAMMMLASVAMAGELDLGESLKKIPGLKQGVGYSALDSEFSYLFTTELVKWDKVSLEAGYNSTDKIIVAVSYDLLKLKDIGVTLPILDLVEIRPCVYAGYGRIAIGRGNAKDNNEFDWGVGTTILTLKY